MSEPEYIKGTRSILLTLSSFENVTVPPDNSYTQVLSSSVRNYLFIDSQSRQQHWLLPTNENVILHRELIFRESHLISKTDSEIAKPNAIAQLYVLTKEDTNNDDLINELDLATLALSTADGKDFTTAIRHIEQYIGSVFIDPHYLLVFYRKSDLFYSSMIDLENFTVVSKQQISLPSMTLALRQGV
ncbi:hypothetical protein ACFOD0_01325 [Shewanella intestini]|uniref:Uncharacterized protein n=1 Tax=Shewanella intestini TaxID=2017544 RepID=A0ABS5HZJ1_9GAMM|nr:MULTISPECIES: hypothetical protein [Shewanella]MBR9727213.1 hypothetical protein [Shewanella intestini]MRG36015.1 hypothetical protein [Shewanella sp. XMDDZSB0408]